MPLAKCIICNSEFDNTPKYKSQKYMRKTCSQSCSNKLKKITQDKIYSNIKNSTRDYIHKNAIEKISFAVYTTIESYKINGKCKKTLLRNDIESKSLSFMPELSNYEEKFRRKCITMAIRHHGYKIKHHYKYDVLFTYNNK